MGRPLKGVIAVTSLSDPRLSRFVGAFLGDGWTRAKGAEIGDYTVGLSIGSSDEPHIYDYLALAELLFPGIRWVIQTGKYRGRGIICSSRIVHSFVRELGIGGDCYTKTLPPLMFDAPENARLALLAGYMDADGHVLKDIKNMSRGHMGGCNQALIEDIRSLAITCGLNVTPVRRYDRKSNIRQQTIYQCWLSGFSTPQIPMWHRTKAKRSKLLVDAQPTRKIKRTPKFPNRAVV